LANNYVKPDDAQASKIAYLECTLKSFTERVDKMASKEFKDAKSKTDGNKDPKNGAAHGG
jgi:hypothetical protein